MFLCSSDFRGRTRFLGAALSMICIASLVATAESGASYCTAAVACSCCTAFAIPMPTWEGRERLGPAFAFAFDEIVALPSPMGRTVLSGGDITPVCWPSCPFASCCRYPAIHLFWRDAAPANSCAVEFVCAISSFVRGPLIVLRFFIGGAMWVVKVAMPADFPSPHEDGRGLYMFQIGTRSHESADWRVTAS